MSYYNNVFDTESRFSSRNSKYSNNSEKSFGSRRWNKTDDSSLGSKQKFGSEPSDSEFDQIFLHTKNQDNYGSFNSNIQSNVTNSPKKNEKPDEIIIKSQKNNTLIPEEYISIHYQQIFAAAILFIIQGYKIYDIVNINSIDYTDVVFDSFINNFAIINKKLFFVVKYFVLESLFFFTIPILRIPYLKFKTVYSTLLLAILTLINATMTLPIFSWLVLSIMSFNSKKTITIGGKYIKPENILKANKHFKGQHIVKLQPQSLATFNPFNEVSCISGNNFIDIPIKVNSTNDVEFWKVQYKGLNDNDFSFFNISTSGEHESFFSFNAHKKENNDIKIFKVDSNKHHPIQLNNPSANSIFYQMRIKNPGFYKIIKAVDTKQLGIKITKENKFIAPQCPSAEINHITSNFDKCHGDENELVIKVNGVFPIKLDYVRTVNGVQEKMSETVLKPQNQNGQYNSPFLATDSNVFSLQTLDEKYVSEFSWASNHNTFSIDISEHLDTCGEYSYQLKSITDAFDNRIELEDKKSFVVHQKPTVEMNLVPDSRSPTKKSLRLKTINNARNYQLNDSPIKVIISQINGANITAEFDSSSHHIIAVKDQGEYKLAGVESKYCPGYIKNNDVIDVKTPYQPDLIVNATTLTNDCIGSVGLKFNLMFVGNPKFGYTYNVYKKNSLGIYSFLEKKTGVSNTIQNEVSYVPNSVGDYKIEFVSVSDENYSDGIKLDASKWTFEITTNIKPEAKILNKQHFKPFNRHAKDLCLNDKTSFDIELIGQKPLSLTYRVMHAESSYTNVQTIENIENDKITISTEDFKKGGKYVVSLVAIKDKDSCSINLLNEQIEINVKHYVPKASFDLNSKNSDIEYINRFESAFVPLNLRGDEPFQVGYTVTDENTGVESSLKYVNINSHGKQAMEFKEAGIYKLKSFKDSNCNGWIENDQQFTIRYKDTPTLKIINVDTYKTNTVSVFSKKDVCIQTRTYADMALQGLAPFKITYDIELPDGKVEANKVLNTNNNKASIALDNNISGLYKLTIKNINDANYKTRQFLTKPIIIEQYVNALPELYIEKQNKGYKTCHANLDEPTAKVTPIYLKSVQKLNANSRFEVQLIVTKDNSDYNKVYLLEAKPTTDLSKLSIDYTEIYKNLSVGKYVLSIVSVLDKVTNCKSSKISETFFDIDITGVPSIKLINDHNHYCVGDTIRYKIDGIPPFNLKYQFNDKVSNVPVKDKNFVRIAEYPGELSIDELKTNADDCVVNYLKPSMKKEYDSLKVIIHEIPTVSLSNGQSSHDDIFAGETSEFEIEFEGIPPFSIIYARFDESGEKISEEFFIDEINDFTYKVETSVPGRYEAIEIRDKYCKIRRDHF